LTAIVEVVAKPAELLALYDVTSELFATLQRWFDVPPQVEVDLAGVDSAEATRQLSDPVMIAAFAMRKLQALHLLSRPGVRTSTDVIVTMVQDLTRALLQAPNMRLNLAAESTDWDAALAELDDLAGLDDLEAVDAPDVEDEDPETERFNELHEQLHIAMYAVLQISDGEIKLLE
jgi:hypothetical protein